MTVPEMPFQSSRLCPGRLFVAGLLGFVLAANAAAEEWPQWGGPDRNFMLPAHALATSWPEGGPPREWAQSLRSPSWAAPTLVGTTLYLRDQNDIVALDLGPPTP